MKNIQSTPAYWVSILAGLPEVPLRDRLRSNFDAGEISRLCDCGCNSFGIEISDVEAIEPVHEPSGVGGKFFELVAKNSENEEIAFLFFADERGYLSGIDITQGSGNHLPLSDNVEITSVLCTV